MHEYVSNELASGSWDEKRLKRAKDVANRKRTLPTQARHGPEKRTQISLSSTDQQLFRGEPTFSIIFSLILFCVCIALAGPNSSQFFPPCFRSGLSACSFTCAGRKQNRSRTCTNTHRKHGGKNCDELGPAKATLEWNPDPCRAYLMFSFAYKK